MKTIIGPLSRKNKSFFKYNFYFVVWRYVYEIYAFKSNSFNKF